MTRTTLFVLIIAGGSLMAGCMMPKSTPSLGTSVKAAVARQIADPSASDRPDPGTGLDGPAAAEGMKEYRKSFKGQEPVTTTFTLEQGTNQ